MALGSTQPLTEMSTRNLPGGGAWGWQPHRHLWADCLENVGASTSHNPMGLHGLLRDSFTFLENSRYFEIFYWLWNPTWHHNWAHTQINVRKRVVIGIQQCDDCMRISGEFINMADDDDLHFPQKITTGNWNLMFPIWSLKHTTIHLKIV
jgi:hypothetical protein